jgi:nucleotide-binding universal stress UspA family protein
MKLSKILVPTDFSEHAQQALETAVSLAKPFGATLHLLHVVQMPLVPTPLVADAAPVVPVTFWQELREHAQRNLEKQKARLAADGVRCELEVIEDVPGFAISAAAERAKADLIVMGSRGLTGIKRVLLGSVAEHTVRAAPCPVLTVKHGGALRMRKILVAMDFSPASQRALEFAQLIAKRAGPAHVILVHAYYVPVELQEYMIQRGQSIPDVLSPRATKELEAILTKLQDAGFSCEYAAAAGAPERVIADVAKDKQVDLIALGTHGRRGLSHLFMGSVAERVVRHSELPVVTVGAKSH